MDDLTASAGCRFEDGCCTTHEVKLQHHHDPMGFGDAYCPTAREREIEERRSDFNRRISGMGP